MRDYKIVVIGVLALVIVLGAFSHLAALKQNDNLILNLNNLSSRIRALESNEGLKSVATLRQRNDALTQDITTLRVEVDRLSRERDLLAQELSSLKQQAVEAALQQPVTKQTKQQVKKQVKAEPARTEVKKAEPKASSTSGNKGMFFKK